ncbi:MAG TPA: replicative DNA helicase, partial [Candidatus Andersenbacteria bacterium]|nr:replicative DNA helicase [Candidatus Andersenbacteria bacterium]
MPGKELRIAPHHTEAEESVLGSILIDKNAVVKVADWIAPEDFYHHNNSIIYEAMMELYSKGDPIDILSVIDRLKEKKELKTIGGKRTITYLATVVPTAGNVIHYGRIVQRNATRRRLISAASDIAEMGFDENDDVETVIDEAENRLFKVSQGHKIDHFTPLSDALEEAFVRIDKLHKGDGALRGVPSGFPSLDKKMAGWQKSDLIILAARPSVGKTTLALDFARHAALAGFKVGVFSLEMSKDQLVDRMLAAHAHVDLWKLRTGKLSMSGNDDDFIRLGDAISELSQATLYIDDNPSANIMGMRT